MVENKNLVRFSCCIDQTIRLDQFLAVTLKLSRRIIKDFILSEKVMLNGAIITKSSVVISKGDILNVYINSEKASSSRINVNRLIYIPNQLISYEDVRIPIIFEDKYLLVLNKPAGLIVHGGHSISSITLADIIWKLFNDLEDENIDHRFGIIHRLDQYTEGLIIVAKTDHIKFLIQEQFKNRSIIKKYYAVLLGNLVNDEGIIDLPIGRDRNVHVKQSCFHFLEGSEKSAITKYWVLNRLSTITFVDIELITGRMHQIRTHFSAKSVPVLGDALYSKQKKSKDGYYLQSYSIAFTHPVTHQQLNFLLPVSDRLKKYK